MIINKPLYLQLQHKKINWVLLRQISKNNLLDNTNRKEKL